MKRRTRYLAAGILAAAKPFFLGALAVRLGLGDSGGTASQVLRYMIFPQVVPAACFFLMYRDETLLRSLRPLAAIYAFGSLILLASLALPIIKDPRSLLLASGGGPGLAWSLAAIGGALLADLGGAIALVPDRHVTPDKES